MRLVRTLFIAVAASAAAVAFVPAAAARGTGGGGGGWNGGSGGGSNWNGGGHWHGGGGHWNGGHWHGGYYPYWPFWGGVAVGVGIGYYGGYYGGYYPYPYPYPYWSSGWGPYYSDAPVTAAPAYGADQTTHSGQPVPQASAPPEPIFYPRNGQSAETTENDRRECNRWATTQPGAMTDASIFQRATFACMEGRGYTVR